MLPVYSDRLHLQDWLTFFSRRTEKALHELIKARRWPWKRKDRQRYLLICTNRLLKIGILNTAHDNSSEARESFKQALSLLEELLALTEGFQPSIQEIHLVTGAILVGLTDQAVSLSGTLMSRFKNQYRTRRKHEDQADYEAVLYRRNGIAAFLSWILDKKTDSLNYGQHALFESESKALLIALLWSKCIVSGLEGNSKRFSEHLTELVKMVESKVASNDPSYGEECLIYTPALSLISLAAKSGIKVESPKSRILVSPM